MLFDIRPSPIRAKKSQLLPESPNVQKMPCIPLVTPVRIIDTYQRNIAYR